MVMLQNPQKSKFRLCPEGAIPGPMINGQETFAVVFHLYDEEDRAMIHEYEDGTKIPIIVISNPMPVVNSKVIAAKNKLIL